MESIIKELWHGNIIPQEDSRTNSKEMKELLGYMARHHEDWRKASRTSRRRSSRSSMIAGARTRVYRKQPYSSTPSASACESHSTAY